MISHKKTKIKRLYLFILLIKSGFDLGSLFCDMMFKNDTEMYPYFEFNYDWYPSKEYQIQFLNSYINEFKNCMHLLESNSDHGANNRNIEQVFNLNLDQLLFEADCFGLAAILNLIFWCVKQASISTLNFPYMVF